MHKIVFDKVGKKYDKDNYAVKDFSLEIEEKDFVVVVGPSGCGKSTSLRMLAGLEEITEGQITIDNKKINDMLPSKRNLAMVFQSYALYPHLNVYNNLAFSLQNQKVNKSIIDEKVNKVSKMLDIDHLLKRKPKELSGGQKQRIALGSALVNDSDILLMDEPLSNLDAKLRVEMRKELIKLHKQLNKTIIYVTHDQVEAMTMATKIVIMKDGLIQQIGSPLELYNSPNNKFVASFIGIPSMNFFDFEVKDGVLYGENNIQLELLDHQKEMLEQNGYNGKKIIAGIRPEDISLDEIFFNTHPQWTYSFEIQLSELVGAETYLYFNGFIVKVNSRYYDSIGKKVSVGFNLNKCHFFDKETEEVIK